MNDETLPGLEIAAAPSGASVLEQTVRAQLQHLQEQGYVTPANAGKAVLCVELAQIIADKRRTQKTSTVSNDARVLMELLDGFVPEGGEVDEGLAAAMKAWEEAQKHGA